MADYAPIVDMPSRTARSAIKNARLVEAALVKLVRL